MAPKLGRRFWLYWTASAASSVGDGVSFVAIPLLATQLTGDPVLISGLRATALAPFLSLTLLAGVIADRTDRLRLMRRTDIARAALIGLTALLAAADPPRLWPLFAVVFLLGTAQTLFDSAAQALLPAIVASEGLERANGRLQSAQAAGIAFLGPPLGGLLFTWHPMAPFIFDAATFGVSAIVLGFAGSAGTGRVPQARSRALLAEMAEGLSLLRSSPLLRLLAATLVTLAFTTGLAYGLVALYATVTLGLSAQGFAMFLVFGAAGSIAGGAVAARVRARLGTVWSVRLAVHAVVLCVVLLGLTRQPLLAMGIDFVLGAAVTVWNVIAVSLRQRAVPGDLLGRVSSAFRMATLGAQGIGMLLGGWLAAWQGIQFPFVAGGLAGSVAVAVLSTRLAATGLGAAAPGRQGAGKLP